MTEEASTKLIVDHVDFLTTMWHAHEEMSCRERMEGLAFSIMVMLDGDAGPGELHLLDEDGNDLSGGLHEYLMEKQKEAKR